MEFLSLHHLTELLHTYGYVVVGLVIALESIGLPLPGETLLISGAVLAATSNQLNIVLVILSAALGAIVGQIVGYLIGWLVGFRLLQRYGRHIGLTEQRLAYGRALFERHGAKVIIGSRFIVLLRTIAALLAGANHMPWARFVLADIAGSVAWSTLYGGGAYLLGHEAKHLAGPAAIAIGVIAAAALVAAGIYVRRREHELVGQTAPTAPGDNND
jgi:membrane protein DedA with SNARE-associated domain